MKKKQRKCESEDFRSCGVELSMMMRKQITFAFGFLRYLDIKFKTLTFKNFKNRKETLVLLCNGNICKSWKEEWRIFFGFDGQLLLHSQSGL